MTIPRLQESPIDHHIQAKILQKLFSSDSPVSFSDLKPSDIENSLFMYHVRKLEDRGLIVRGDKGFKLTPDGARWVNFASPNKLKSRLNPRLLINLIITTPDKQKVLVSRRKSAAAAYMTHYLLPSGFHMYDVPIREAAHKVAKSITGADVKVDYYDTYETILRASDGYVHHVLLPTFHGQMEEMSIPNQEHYEALWVPVAELVENADKAYDEPLPEIIRKYMAGEPFDYETIVIESA